MSALTNCVKSFMRAFGTTIPEGPTTDISDVELITDAKLLLEETLEVIEAMGVDVWVSPYIPLNGEPITLENLLFDRVRDIELPHAAQELADVAYVVSYFANRLGIPLDAAIAEVHQANMSKLDADGRPVRNEFGRIMKSELYRKPDMTNVIQRADEKLAW